MELGRNSITCVHRDDGLRNRRCDIGIADYVVGGEIGNGLRDKTSIEEILYGKLYAGALHTLFDDGTRTPTPWPWSTPFTETAYRREVITAPRKYDIGTYGKDSLSSGRSCEKDD